MYDVVVYLSSLPRISDRNRKIEVLTAFAQGAQKTGARVLVQTERKIVDCRLAVILGWVGTTISGPHIQLRKDVIAHQQKTGNHVMPIDSSCFKFADAESYFLRYSLDGVFYNTNNYSNRNSNDVKWKQIKAHLGIELYPWRTNGEHILVCLQRDGGWSLKGTNLNLWAQDKVKQIRQLTQRPILIRPHPKAHTNLDVISQISGVQISQPGITLAQDLKNAWASVFYNSSSSVASVLAGVPIFADDNDCVAWNIANTNLNQIENPSMPDRTQWLNDLSSAHWSDEESRAGLIYQKFLPFI